MSPAPPAPEYWLRGPIDGVPGPLMPAAHALLQTLEDVERAVEGLTIDQIWQTPGGASPIGFHLMHLSGSTDRLLTYARGQALDGAQKEALGRERHLPRSEAAPLVAEFRRTVEAALAQIRSTPPSTLADVRAVGRAGLPTTVLGLIFHAAEHSQRHAGQVVTTAKIVRNS